MLQKLQVSINVNNDNVNSSRSESRLNFGLHTRVKEM